MHDAFVLAAGFGTRLKPLTLVRPKPLVPVCGVPMLSYALALCATHGLERVMVNAHYLGDQLVPWAGRHEGIRVTINQESPDILGTGGGLKAVEAQLAPKVVVVNADTLCDVDLTALRAAVPDGGGAMALRVDPADAAERYGVVAYDDEDRITDLKKLAVVDPVGRVHTDAHFTGIHALDRQMLNHVPDGFSCIVRTAYIAEVPRRNVVAVRHGGTWLDVGDPQAYLQTNLAVLHGLVNLPLDPWDRAAGGVRVGEQSTVDGGVLHGPVWLGQGAKVHGSARRSIIGAGAHVPSGADLDECVVWEGVHVPAGVHRRQVFHA
ncbi:MAG: sugar phosphate nucleotidyltransferase [Myxococcota bacterium]